MIYFLTIFLIDQRDIKWIAGFLVTDFLLDTLLHNYIKPSVSEYLMVITLIEVTGVMLLLQKIKRKFLGYFFIFCYTSTLICPFFLLTIDHWIKRDDYVSEALFLICSEVGKYSNEALLTYLLYKFKENTPKLVFWKTFIIGNYLLALSQVV